MAILDGHADFHPGLDDEESKIALRIIHHLAQERERQGLTLRALGLKTGYHFTLFGKAENGKVQIGVVPLLKWIKALDLDCVEVLRLAISTDPKIKERI